MSALRFSWKLNDARQPSYEMRANGRLTRTTVTIAAPAVISAPRTS